MVRRRAGRRPLSTGQLPPFPPGLVGLLATADDEGRPHAIPVSALHRAGPRRVLLALAPGRGSLARLRRHPHVALALLGQGFSVTAEGPAAVVADPLPDAPHVVAVELRAERVVDTLGTRTEIHGGVRWGWRPAADASGRPSDGERHDATLAALARLAATGPG